MTSSFHPRRVMARAFSPVNPFEDHSRDSWAARVRGPLGIIVLAGFLEVLSQAGFAVPHVESFLILLVAYVAFVDGVLAGMASAAMAVVYYGYTISDYGRGLYSAVLPWEDMVIVGSSMLVLAGMVGLLRRQLERSRGGERAARDRMVEVLGGLSSGFVIVESSGEVGYANGRAPELLDVPGGRDFAEAFWGAIRADLGTDAVERLRASHAAGEAGLFEVRHARNGVWLEVQAHPITSGMAVFLTDTTARRREREQSQAIRRMQAIAGLSGGIAHRFNNLLTAIQGYGELALHTETASEGIRPHLVRIQEASRTAAQLVQQLQSYSRQQLLRPRVMSLSESLSDLEPRISGRLRPEQSLRLEPGLDPLPVHLDSTALDQIVMGLADHAAFSMGDSGRLTVSARAMHLDQPAQGDGYSIEAGAYAVLEFRDTGPGMNEETRQRIFEPFYVSTGVGASDGLALAAIYGTVKQSGGYIEVGRAPEESFTFRVWLPASTLDLKRVRRQARPESGTIGATILLAEDDEAILTLAVRILRAAGHTVIAAATAELAVAAAYAHDGPIDLLITDVVMPGMGGRELAREILLERPDTDILYMSGYTDARLIRGGIARGVLEADLSFLPKPFTPSELAAQVEAVLERSRGAVVLQAG